MFRFLLLVPGTLFLLASCSKGSEPMPAPVYLLDQRWELTELAGQPATPEPGAPAPDLTLHSVGNASTGRVFCNQYMGQYELIGGSPQLHFTVPGATQASCPSQDLETRYFQLLPQVARYVISNHQLALYDDVHAQPLLVFKAAE